MPVQKSWPAESVPDQEDQSQALYQDRQNPYSWKLFGEKRFEPAVVFGSYVLMASP